MNCYNCGVPLTHETNHVEHIPQKSLYAGRGPEYKVNLKTVPACFNCNNKEFSAIDEEFRNLIGLITEKPGHDELIKSSVKSVNRGQAKQSRIVYDGDEFKGILFKPNILKDSHTKNFKGVFYTQYGYPISNNYKISVDIIGVNRNLDPHRQKLKSYLVKNFEWKFSGHPDIFSYIIQPFREVNKFDKQDIKIEHNERIFICVLRYNLSLEALVWAKLK